MKMFTKLNNGQQLFTKNNGNQSFFKKLNTAARQFDNSLVRVGSFLKPVASQLGFGGVNSIVDRVTVGVHNVRNALEKATMGKLEDLRPKHV